MEKQKVLEIKDLEVRFLTEEDTVCAVNGIDLSINQGESLGLVGETGAGKTTTCLAIMQLIPDPPGLITKGEITFCGENMLQNTEKKNAEIRGKGISMIFQVRIIVEAVALNADDLKGPYHLFLCLRLAQLFMGADDLHQLLAHRHHGGSAPSWDPERS